MNEINIVLGLALSHEDRYSLKFTVNIPEIIPNLILRVLGTDIKLDINNLYYDTQTGKYTLFDIRDVRSVMLKEDVKRLQSYGWIVHDIEGNQIIL